MKTSNKIGNALSNTGKFIGNNKMPLLYVGLGVAVLVVAYPLIKSLVKTIKGQDIKDTKDDTKAIDIAKLKNLTISEVDANRMAEQLLVAFSVTSGTDLTAIEKVFATLKTQDDFMLLYKAFGMRTYSNVNTGSPTGALWGILERAGGYQDMNLMGWLNEELDFTDYTTKQKIRAKLPPNFILS